MDLNEYSWNLGEIAKLPRVDRVLKEGDTNQYEQFITSRYLCIREATDHQQGILLKVLGKADPDEVKVISGEPFCQDDYVAMFAGHCYFSYPFPKSNQVKEVLDILRQSPRLLMTLESLKMHINPNSMFWVSETARNAFFLKIPQVYDSRTDQLLPASKDTLYYRISIVYFFEGELIW
jgi:hypothetical protein